MKKYVLTEEELTKLLADSLELKALNYVFVDTWEGYREAFEQSMDYDSENECFNVEPYLKNYKQLGE
jgi:hypothetical protein